MIRFLVAISIVALYSAIYANVVPNPYAAGLMTIVSIVFLAIIWAIVTMLGGLLLDAWRYFCRLSKS